MEEEKVVDFLDGVDPENVTQEIWRSLNKLYSYVSHLVNYKNHLILYRLMKKLSQKQAITIDDLAEAAKCSKTRLYKIVAEFEKREVKRINEEDI